MMDRVILDVARDEVDGVPVFVAAVPPGPALGVLMFRVGVADETVARRGITHLVEHLALHDVDRRAFEFNATVGPAITAFYASGEPDEVGRFLSTVARNLTALPLDRLVKETQVLRAEQAQRASSSLVGDALWARFGACGYGLVDLHELYMFRATGSDLESWSREAFTVENAALVLSCPPPTTLDLSALPRGTVRPPVAATEVQRPHPVWMTSAPATVAVTTVMHRSIESSAAIWVFVEQCREELRHRLGLIYDVAIDTLELSGRLSHHTIASQCSAEHAPEVLARMQTEVARLRYEGCSEAMLGHYKETVERTDREPYAGIALAQFVAIEHLFGEPPKSMPEMTSRIASMTADDVSATISDLEDAMMWLVPNGCDPPDRRLTAALWGVSPPVTGRRLAPTASSAVGHWLTAGPEGMTLGDPGGGTRTILTPDLAGYMRWLGDGGRSLYAIDGTVIHVIGSGWQGGAEAIAEFDGYIPVDLMVDRPDSLRG